MQTKALKVSPSRNNTLSKVHLKLSSKGSDETRVVTFQLNLSRYVTKTH